MNNDKREIAKTVKSYTHTEWECPSCVETISQNEVKNFCLGGVFDVKCEKMIDLGDYDAEKCGHEYSVDAQDYK